MNEKIPYSQFACVGAGFSGIALGATLKRWYNNTDIRLFERHSSYGGTWYANKYPGAACDVPSALYSLSFEPNPDWSRICPTRDELLGYQIQVAKKYNLMEKTTFNVEVVRCEWIEEAARWLLTYRDVDTGKSQLHEAQFLFLATGQLVVPRELDIPGTDTFHGPIFHSAQWQSGVDLTNKHVIVIGNGCTGNQIIPALAPRVKHLTHLVRSKHWVLPPIDGEVPNLAKTVLKWVPGSMFWLRFCVFALAEDSLRGFPLTESAQRFRNKQWKVAESYMRRTAPSEYHEKLIPDFEVGCKRRIFDSGYLKSLHRENVRLTDEKGLEVVPEGIRTEKGVIKADAIILANGFKTNHFFSNIEIIGRGGVSMGEHWDSFGGPEAYNCTVMSGFPNLFTSQGPNSATGHSSGLIAAENSIYYTMRVIKPILDGKASIANVSRAAEEDYVNRLQGALQKTVWFSGCASWYVNEGDGRKWNSMSYPWSQGHYWFRSLFPDWSHWEYSVSVVSCRTRKLIDVLTYGQGRAEKPRSSLSTWIRRMILTVVAVTAGLALVWNTQHVEQQHVVLALIQTLKSLRPSSLV